MKKNLFVIVFIVLFLSYFNGFSEQDPRCSNMTKVINEEIAYYNVNNFYAENLSDLFSCIPDGFTSTTFNSNPSYVIIAASKFNSPNIICIIYSLNTYSITYIASDESIEVPSGFSFDGNGQPITPGDYTIMTECPSYSSIIMGFEEQDTIEFNHNWKVEIDSNYPGASWSIYSFKGLEHSGSYSIGIHEYDKYWMYSRGFNLKSSLTYKITFWYLKFQYDTVSQNLKLCMGNLQDSSSMNRTLFNIVNINNENYNKATVVFTVPNDSIYYFGWFAYGGFNIDYDYIFIDDISLSTYVCDSLKPNISFNKHGMCHNSGDSVLIEAAEGFSSYNWNNGLSSNRQFWVKTPGKYIVEVTNSVCCSGKDSIIIYDYQLPDINIVTTTGKNYMCGNDSLYLFVNNNINTMTLSYNWNNGLSTDSYLYAKATGEYYVECTSQNGCKVRDSISILSSLAPELSLLTAGSENICNSDSVVLKAYITNASGHYYILTWMPDNIIGDSAFTVRDIGNYYFVVTDTTTNCQYYSPSVNIINSPNENNICLVTVDSLTGKNMVVWEKTNNQSLKSYKIYKESTSSGTYELIRTTPFASNGIFIDEASEPVVRAARYKISTVDSCEHESALSGFHKTIHLTINMGINGYRNLIWDAYEGFSFNSYYIYKSTSVNPNQFSYLATIQSTLYSYTDTATNDSVVHYYLIKVIPENPCNFYKKAGSITSSFSNIASDKKSKINELNQDNNSISIYPNPVKDLVNITYELNQNAVVQIDMYNILGENIESLIKEIQLTGKHNLNINTSNLDKGVYFIKFRIKNNFTTQKLIKI